MKSRYFAFGCSYVDSRWGTVADLIGANFDEFYNLGNPGGCNTLMANRLIEIDDIFKLNSETDFVTIGVTGIGRFSFVDKNDRIWMTPGDVFHDNPEPFSNLKTDTLKFVAKQLLSRDYVVYNSWVAIKTISTILKSKNIRHKIYPSIDNLLFITDYDLPTHTVEKVKDMLNTCDIKESVDEFGIYNDFVRGVKYKDGNSDSHPTQLQHYEYLKKHFKEFDTEKTLERYNFLESIFDYDSINTQALNFYKLYINNYRNKNYELWTP